MKRRSWMIPTLLALSLMLAACGGQTSGGAAILPLEEIPGADVGQVGNLSNKTEWSGKRR